MVYVARFFRQKGNSINLKRKHGDLVTLSVAELTLLQMLLLLRSIIQFMHLTIESTERALM